MKQSCVNLKFDWNETEGQHLLRFKYAFFEEYFELQRQGKTKETVSGINEEAMNQLMLAAYRKGLIEGRDQQGRYLKYTLSDIADQIKDIADAITEGE